MQTLCYMRYRHYHIPGILKLGNDYDPLFADKKTKKKIKNLQGHLSHKWWTQDLKSHSLILVSKFFQLCYPVSSVIILLLGHPPAPIIPLGLLFLPCFLFAMSAFILFCINSFLIPNLLSCLYLKAEKCPKLNKNISICLVPLSACHWALPNIILLFVLHASLQKISWFLFFF